MIDEMKASKGDKVTEDNLDARYGAIGISAVAAAVRYQGGGRNAASRSADPDPATTKRRSDLAA